MIFEGLLRYFCTYHYLFCVIADIIKLKPLCFRFMAFTLQNSLIQEKQKKLTKYIFSIPYTNEYIYIPSIYK